MLLAKQHKTHTCNEVSFIVDDKYVCNRTNYISFIFSIVPSSKHKVNE